MFTIIFFFKQKTAYEMRISDWSSDVCSSDLRRKPMKSIAILAKSLLLSLVLTASAFAADKVNINTADATAIADTLTGVGQSKAEAIVTYRKAHGAFKSADQQIGRAHV